MQVQYRLAKLFRKQIQAKGVPFHAPALFSLEKNVLDSQKRYYIPEEKSKNGKKSSLMGMFKQYGAPFIVYWWSMWMVNGLTLYGGLSVAGIDATPVITFVDERLSTSFGSTITPSQGNVAVAIVLNEMVEVVRFPFCVATIPKVVKRWENFKNGR